jgi:hypothetical protein
MELVLSPHRSVQSPRWKVSGSVARTGRQLLWQTRVENFTRPHVNTSFGCDPRKNWELWNWDVVEAFFQLRPTAADLTAPYLEVQLSPLNQGLVIVIIEPRRKFYTPLQLLWRSTSEQSRGVWQTEVELTLPADFPEGDLWGGVFACLGDGKRDFYSLHPNPEERPDFHRPELFQRL